MGEGSVQDDPSGGTARTGVDSEDSMLSQRQEAATQDSARDPEALGGRTERVVLHDAIGVGMETNVVQDHPVTGR